MTYNINLHWYIHNYDDADIHRIFGPQFSQPKFSPAQNCISIGELVIIEGALYKEGVKDIDRVVFASCSAVLTLLSVRFKKHKLLCQYICPEEALSCTWRLGREERERGIMQIRDDTKVMVVTMDLAYGYIGMSLSKQNWCAFTFSFQLCLGVSYLVHTWCLVKCLRDCFIGLCRPNKLAPWIWSVLFKMILCVQIQIEWNPNSASKKKKQTWMNINH